MVSYRKHQNVPVKDVFFCKKKRNIHENKAKRGIFKSPVEPCLEVFPLSDKTKQVFGFFSYKAEFFKAQNVF